MSEWACDRIEELEKQLEDAKTVEAFWRRAAEQALRLWERAQDEKAAARIEAWRDGRLGRPLEIEGE